MENILFQVINNKDTHTNKWAEQLSNATAEKTICYCNPRASQNTCNLGGSVKTIALVTRPQHEMA